MYVGVHVPFGRESKRRHRHRGHKHHRKKKERDSEEGKEDGRDSPTYGWPLFQTHNTKNTVNILVTSVSSKTLHHSLSIIFHLTVLQLAVNLYH